ncbi:MAG: phage recombination protein Bet [Acholeplasmataceae bacterium]|nr:phage recombination protein Bet [Acholeplasmataceae bacterium]
MNKDDIKKLNAEALEEQIAPVKYEIDGHEIKLSPTIVKRFITGGQEITESEYKLFVELCIARKLNPFLKEVHLIKYSDTSTAQIVVGKDAIVKRAVTHKSFNGRQQGVIVKTEDGKIEYRNGALVIEGETLVGGWARVYRKGWDYPVETAVSLKEAIQTKGDGKPNTNWANRPATMVEKVALVRALREAFVEDVGGLIDEDEAWQNMNNKPTGSVVETTVQVDPTTGEVEVQPVQKKKKSLDDI